MTARVRNCAVCKQQIESERLELVANTRLCAEHARAIQKFGGEFLYTGKNILPKLGVKPNYGDVTVRWKCNEEGLRRLLDEYDAEQWARKERQNP